MESGKGEKHYDIIGLNLDLLQGRRRFDEVKNICEENIIYSMPDITYQAQDSDKDIVIYKGPVIP